MIKVPIFLGHGYNTNSLLGVNLQKDSGVNLNIHWIYIEVLQDEHVKSIEFKLSLSSIIQYHFSVYYMDDCLRIFHFCVLYIYIYFFFLGK